MSSRRPRPRCTHALGPTAVLREQLERQRGQATRHGRGQTRRGLWADAALFLDGLDRQEIFTVDDLRESIGEPQGSGNQFGSVIRGWAAADKIIHHGYRPSRIKSNHGHMVRVWRKA